MSHDHMKNKAKLKYSLCFVTDNLDLEHDRKNRDQCVTQMNRDAREKVRKQEGK